MESVSGCSPSCPDSLGREMWRDPCAGVKRHNSTQRERSDLTVGVSEHQCEQTTGICRAVGFSKCFLSHDLFPLH